MAAVGLEQSSASLHLDNESALDTSADFSLRNPSLPLDDEKPVGYRFFTPNGRTAPTNEHAVAMPVFTLGCSSQTGLHRGRPCYFSRHHLHSTDPLYKAAGVISAEFKELETLTVWTPRCRHNQHHSAYEVNTVLPSIEIMEQCIYEERIIRDIINNTKTINMHTKGINNPDYHRNDVNGRIRLREKELSKRPDLLARIREIVVTPEELVTGALLLVAPNQARSRMLMGSGYVLTGTIPKPEIGQAIEVAGKIELANKSLQTGVNEVKLAA